MFRGSYLFETTHFFAHPVGGLGRGNMCLEVPISNLRKHFSPNRFICRGSGGLVSEFLVPPRIGDAGTTAARRGAHRGAHRGPAAGKCPVPGSRDSPDRAKAQFGSKNDEKVKVLRMESSIVENLSGPQESIFSLFRGPQLNSPSSLKIQKLIEFYRIPPNSILHSR